MPDFRRIYAHAEEHTVAYVIGLFAFFAVLLGMQAFVSGLAILSIVIAAVFAVLTVYRPLWTLTFLSVYLPFEPLLLKFTPDDIYLFARFLSEALVYLLVAVVIWKRLSGEAGRQQTPIGLPFTLFVVVAVASAIINFVDPTVAILGLRQILRFVLVFFVVVYLQPRRDYIRRLTVVMFAVVLFQAGLGICQAVIGAPLDEFLLPSESRTFGEITLTSGVAQFWDPGSRVFATLGRYDRLGTFLAFFLLIASALLYERQVRKERKELWWLFVLGIPALVLTYSRSSWFGFLLGFLFIALWMKRDKRVLTVSLLSAAAVAVYLLYSGLVVQYLVDVPRQTVIERFFEAFSYERWRGEYYGLGRLYWIVQTVLVVIPAAPLFGFGPGQYGGGAVAALGNGTVYERLGLPFGVYGTDGYIDNNWFSLWGETGTLGLAFYAWMYAALFLYAVKVYRGVKDDPFARALALGFAAAMIAVALNAFLATFLEVRTLAFYLWLYGGFVVVLGKTNKVSL
jgi:O-antigen ligase